jgi:hypothetical protein
MDPRLRLSGGDWFTLDPNYAVSRAISREEYMFNKPSSTNAYPMTSIKTELAIPTVGGGGGDSGATRAIRVVAVAILMDGACKIGDHIVSKNHHHALPLFVVEFKREAGGDSLAG